MSSEYDSSDAEDAGPVTAAYSFSHDYGAIFSPDFDKNIKQISKNKVHIVFDSSDLKLFFLGKLTFTLLAGAFSYNNVDYAYSTMKNKCITIWQSAAHSLTPVTSISQDVILEVDIDKCRLPVFDKVTFKFKNLFHYADSDTVFDLEDHFQILTPNDVHHFRHFEELDHGSDVAKLAVNSENTTHICLGVKNSGKSTFNRQLLETYRSAGKYVQFIDLDPGQQMFGELGCISVFEFQPYSSSGTVVLGDIMVPLNVSESASTFTESVNTVVESDNTFIGTNTSISTNTVVESVNTVSGTNNVSESVNTVAESVNTVSKSVNTFTGTNTFVGTYDCGKHYAAYTKQVLALLNQNHFDGQIVIVNMPGWMNGLGRDFINLVVKTISSSATSTQLSFLGNSDEWRKFNIDVPNLDISSINFVSKNRSRTNLNCVQDSWNSTLLREYRLLATLHTEKEPDLLLNQKPYRISYGCEEYNITLIKFTQFGEKHITKSEEMTLFRSLPGTIIGIYKTFDDELDCENVKSGLFNGDFNEDDVFVTQAVVHSVDMDNKYLNLLISEVNVGKLSILEDSSFNSYKIKTAAFGLPLYEFIPATKNITDTFKGVPPYTTAAPLKRHEHTWRVRKNLLRKSHQ